MQLQLLDKADFCFFLDYYYHKVTSPSMPKANLPMNSTILLSKNIIIKNIHTP